jgi:hypothetical protein
MTDFGFGVLCGSLGTFIAMVALIAFVNYGPGDKVWEIDDE